MEKPKEYHLQYQRYVLGVQNSGMTLWRTLGLTAIGYMLAHMTEFRRSNTSVVMRGVYLFPIMTAAYGWNLVFDDANIVAALRNNGKEVAHQSAFGKTIE